MPTLQNQKKGPIDTRLPTRQNTQDLVSEQEKLTTQQQSTATNKVDTDNKNSTRILEQLLIELGKPENKDLSERLAVHILDRIVHPPTMPEHLIESILTGGGKYHYLPWWHYLWAKRLWFSISASCMLALLFGYVFTLWSLWLQPFLIATIGGVSLYMQYQIFGPKIQKASMYRNKLLKKELLHILFGSLILLLVLLILRMIHS